MNPDTGAWYDELSKAEAAGEKREDLVEIIGTEQQVRTISRAIQLNNAKQRRRARNKAARRSRRTRR